MEFINERFEEMRPGVYSRVDGKALIIYILVMYRQAKRYTVNQK